MQAALIVMTILGCDDSINQCKYIDTVDQRFVSVELCDAAGEKMLAAYGDVSFPTVVAVCRKPDDEPVAALTAPPPATVDDTETAKAVTVEPQAGAVPVPEPNETEQKTFAARAVSTIREALPGKAKVKMVFATPIHVVADSYAWVARKISHPAQ